jgi:hypothetical protein
MRRTLLLLVLGTPFCLIGLATAAAQEAKKTERPQIPGGIEGHLKSVDVDKETITLVTSAGTQRTFNVTEDTTMLGPRGGRVRRRLHDPRFHEGMEMTVVASGPTAREIHLGFSHRATGGASRSEKSAANTSATKEKGSGVATTAPAAKTKVYAKQGAAAAAKAPASEEEDEDDEIPGTVKSYNADRRLLVVSLLNGTSRSFFLSRDLKVLVRGTESKEGVADPALKEGAHVAVVVEDGGRRVKELHVNPAPPARRTKKAA